MNSYKALHSQIYTLGEYKLVPIRFEDRMHIMKWRNEQIFHLRQSKPLTEEEQDAYFNGVVRQLFDQKQPNQILFSFLKSDVCIGYGGMVHINWVDKHAELSFLINTELENDFFHQLWSTFLLLIEKVAFDDLLFHKIYTYAFDLRPHLYDVLEKHSFNREAVLIDHVLFNNQYINAVMHAKLNAHIYLRPACLSDTRTAYSWANDPIVRKFSFAQEKIEWSNHNQWFEGKVHDPNCYYYFLLIGEKPLGSIRFDMENSNTAKINYLIDPAQHGKKLGLYILAEGIRKLYQEHAEVQTVYGLVMDENVASLRIFQKLGFNSEKWDGNVIKFTKKITYEDR
jgi:RimJ/RimL family protein N-acetyltransferase